MLAGCGPAATFMCSADDDCRDGDRIGFCEADHYCSFGDDACPSRRRYGELAPPDLAGECVPVDGASSEGTASLGETSAGGETTTVPATSTSPTSDTSTSSSGESGTPAEWWDSAWSRRVEITVSYDGTTDELVGVPLLAVLTDDRFDANVASADGSDLRFVSADGTEVFPHQIDSFLPDVARMVWFRMPAITGNDTLWLYYGNPAAMDGGSPEVWGTEHVAVFHMGAAIVDASASLGRVATQAVGGPGMFGEATIFDAFGGPAELGDLDALRALFFPGASVSAWIQPTGWGVGGNWGRVLDKMDLPSDGNGYGIMVEAAGRFRLVQGFVPGESGWETDAGNLALGQWSYVSLSYRAVDIVTPPTLYIDGVPHMLTQNFTADGAPLGDDGVSAAIGGRIGPDVRSFEGSIDELRIESVERPPQWHELQYLTMTDAALQWGRTEVLP